MEEWCICIVAAGLGKLILPQTEPTRKYRISRGTDKVAFWVKKEEEYILD